MSYKEDLEALQKNNRANQEHIRLLWSLLRTMEEQGWQEDKINAPDWLRHTLEERERSERELEWFRREEVAQDCLVRANNLVGELSDALGTFILPAKIMSDGTQVHLEAAQNLLSKINEQIKHIYDMRRGLTK